MVSIDWKIICVGIICISALEGYALYKGIDGTLFTMVIAAIAGICGWTLPQLKTQGGQNGK